MARLGIAIAIFGALTATCGSPELRAQAAAPGATTLQPSSLRIAAGTLDDALKSLAVQARVQVLYDPALVAGLGARALSGRVPPMQALGRLLERTGLRAVAVGGDAFVIERIRSAVAPVPPRHVPPPPPAPRSPVDLGTVHVTGTHISRVGLDALSPSPMTLISREDIETSGSQTLFELLRFQPGMVGHHPVDVAADGSPGSQQPFATAATTSLNALGPRATLFLVDGHRIANYGLISADLGGLTDLDSIPLSIVERIEIIRGGASAIYGADAMAGVVNIILRKQQLGGEAVARYGVSSRSDASQRQWSFGIGGSTALGGNVFLGVDLLDRDRLLGAQRKWRSFDQSAYGLGDWRFALGYRDEDGLLLQRYCPGADAAVRRTCQFDPARYMTLQPAVQRGSVYAHIDQPLGGSARWHADVRASRTRQTLDSPPFHARIRLPEDYPGTFAGTEFLDYVFFDTGSIRNHSSVGTLDLSAGLEGDWDGWRWQLGLSHHDNAVTNRLEGLVRYSALDQAIGDYSYLFGRGQNPPDVLARVSPPVSARGHATLQQFSAGVDGQAFAVPAGQAKVAAGIEIFRDDLGHEPDALMLEHDVALGPQKVRIHQQRYSAAVYSELSLPLTRALHADLALRLDHRQGYGSQLSPRVGLKWRARDTLTLRGTAATGYRAPSLFELRRPNVEDGYELVRETPGLAPCRYRFADGPGAALCLVERGAADNPELMPETSSSQTLGLVWTPSPQLTVSLDRFRIIRRNEIVPGSAIDDVAAFPRSLRRDAAGLLVGIDEYFANLGRTDARGWELDARYGFTTQRWGDYAVRVGGNVLSRLALTARPGVATVNHAGYGTPSRSLLASLQWRRNDWVTTLNARNLGAARVGSPDRGCPRVNAGAGRCITPGSTVYDLDLAYAGLRDWRLGLNVRDIGDHRPINFDVLKGGYEIAYDDPRGRYFLLSAAYRF